MISDNVLFVMLLAVLGVALLLRSVIRDSAPDSKIGYASTSAAITGVASVVVGGLLLKFFPESGMDLLGAALMILGFIAIGLGLLISLIVLFRIPGDMNIGDGFRESNENNEESFTDQRKPKDRNDDYPNYLEYLMIKNAQDGDPNKPI